MQVTLNPWRPLAVVPMTGHRAQPAGGLSWLAAGGRDVVELSAEALQLLQLKQLVAAGAAAGTVSQAQGPLLGEGEPKPVRVEP